MKGLYTELINNLKKNKKQTNKKPEINKHCSSGSSQVQTALKRSSPHVSLIRITGNYKSDILCCSKRILIKQIYSFLQVDTQQFLPSAYCHKAQPRILAFSSSSPKKLSLLDLYHSACCMLQFQSLVVNILFAHCVSINRAQQARIHKPG